MKQIKQIILEGESPTLINRHLKELCESKIFMVFAKIDVDWKKYMLFPYTEKC